MNPGTILVLIALVLAIVRLAGVSEERLTAAAVALVALALLIARVGL